MYAIRSYYEMITKANRNDITRLSEIHVYGWRHAYKNIISDEELFKNINVERSKSIFSKIINEEKENLDIYNDGIVITSYSIHYTKLYESFKSATAPSEAQP